MVGNVLLWLLFGAVVGWLAGMIMNKKNTLLWNVILGIAGSFVGGYIASKLGYGSLSGGYSFNFGNIAISVGGACVVILVAKILKIVK